MTDEYFNADEEELPEALGDDEMDDLMDELDIENIGELPNEDQIEDLMDFDGTVDNVSEEDDETPAIPEIPDAKQPISNVNVDESEVQNIIHALNEGYFSEKLDDDELSPLIGLVMTTTEANKEEQTKKLSKLSPIYTPEIDNQPLSSKQLLLENLETVIGDKATKLISKIANSHSGSIANVAKIIPLADIARIDILDNKDGRPRFIQLIDINGVDVSSMLKLPLNEDGEIEVQQLLDNSVFTNLKHDTDNGYKADGMGAALQGALTEFETLINEKENRQKRIDLLKWMRTLIFKLNDVFGFDNYQQLEALIAAWLMKNSTCRLSGIPGTGKTTVINCAATLLGNSYGFHTGKTYVAGTQYLDDFNNAPTSNFYGTNQSSDNIYKPVEFDKGMYYDIKYNQKVYEGIASDWNVWRFEDWSQPELDDNNNYNYTKSKRSGAYQYNFKFLRNQEPEVKNIHGSVLFPSIDSKKVITVDTYRELFVNCWTVLVPKDFNLNIYNEDTTNKVDPFKDNPHWNPNGPDNGKAYKECEKVTFIKPIQIIDRNGEFVAFEQGDKPKYGPYEMGLRNSQHDSQFYGQMLKSIPLSARKQLILTTQSSGIYTDAGRNEGYWFREMLCHFLRDKRASPESKNGIDEIGSEMLQEIGVAKIDYDKRPDEVLYGLEIQSVTETNPVTGAETNTFVFEPEPKPIVTQSIKFFNEANRSQSGVEDAILGLLAEREVEYRGKVFKSPPFVAWMDTNPHQKGNDLAFTDRIDMELLFRSVGLGGRYDQLMGEYGGAGAGEPQLRIVQDMTQTNSGFTPMRMNNLMKVWGTVSKLGFTPPGASYNGLRDISMLSMLFSQRFAKRPTSIEGGGQTIDYSFNEGLGNIHESPLLDYSITTNTESSGEVTTTPLISEADLDAGSLLSFGDFSSSDSTNAHVPSSITRVLGFRFTKSIVKLSQALSFLRGKEYVGRKEILDAVPYTLAHRLGRAKSGALDLAGNNKGIDGSQIKYVNEQEFIREILVRGYIENKVTTGVGEQGQNILDNWDLFYQRCRDVLSSVPSVWQYEADVMLPLHQAIREGDAASMTSVTPVHWHIATMVVEEERMASNKSNSTTKPNRSYDVENAGADGKPKNLGDYSSMYSYFQNMILDPTGGGGEPILFDFYRVRGIIARNQNLFSHDRARLLSMLDSEIRSIAGSSVLNSPQNPIDALGTGSIQPFPMGVTKRPVGTIPSGTVIGTQNDFYGDSDGGPADKPARMGWRTYYDSMGPYGILIQRGQTSGLNAMDLGASGGIATPMGLTADGNATAINNADQGLRSIGRYMTQQSGNKSLNSARSDILTVLNNFYTTFEQYVTEGHIFTNFGDAANMTMVKIGFEEWCNDAITALKKNVDDPNNAPDDDVIGCFVLKHAPTTVPQATNRGMHGDDTLRLWVRLQRAGLLAEAQPSENDSEYVTMVFTAGITSALGTTQKENTGELAQGTQIYILPADFKDQYHTTSFAIEGTWGAAGNDWMKQVTAKLPTKQRIDTNSCLIDTGNMSLQDRNFFNARFKDCIQ